MSALLMRFVWAAIAIAVSAFIELVPLSAEDQTEKLSVKIGQRFEPIVQIFQTIKSRYETAHPGSFYQGFVATSADKNINGGIPLGASFGSPITLRLEHEEYSLTFPTGKFTSFSFDESGELEYFSFNPQLTYSNGVESAAIIEKLNKDFASAGWRQNKGFSATGRWHARWLKGDVYVKRTSCEDSGPREKCELVEVSIARVPKLSAEIVQCGEILWTPAAGKKSDVGSHTGALRVMNEHESPKFKPGCLLIEAKLGSQFGIQVLLKGDEESSISWDLVTRVTHPRFADGATVDEWESPMNIGIERYTGWFFENKSELVPGNWTFEIVLGTETLAKKVFEVHVW